MQILAVDTEPFHKLQYVLSLESHHLIAVLPFYRASVEGLPNALDAIIATGDLQGFEKTVDHAPPERLLGEVLASEIEVLRRRGTLPAKNRTAILLAGDLQPCADTGDVRPVWFALANISRWVAGVAGNHDAFGYGNSAKDARAALNRSGLHFLDETTAKLDGLTIGGISGIVGTREGDWARTETEFAAAISRLAEQGLDLLITHDGPNVAGTNLTGWPSIRRALEAVQQTILIRGHDSWTSILSVLENGTQIINVEGRVVVMCRAVE